MNVSIDSKWFADPARVFPVTIDPWMTFPNAYGLDTYMNTSFPNTTMYSSTPNFLSAGNYGNFEVDRAYFTFGVGGSGLPAWDPSLAIWSAQLSVYNYNGWTNSPATMRVSPVTQFVFPSALTWNVQPTVDPYVPSTTGTIAGGANGGSGWNLLDATPLVRQQLTTGNPSWGVGLLVTADDENDISTGKNFYSTQHANQTGDGSAPALTITFKHVPTATNLVAPVDQASVATTTPTLTAQKAVSPDGDNANMQYWFQLATGADGYSGTVIYASGWQLVTPDGNGNVSWTVPAGYLNNGGAYHWTVRAFDGFIWNNYVPAWTIKVDLRLGATGPSPFDSIGPVNVNLANGNVNYTTKSRDLPAVGGNVGFTYSYNSQAPSQNGLTGTYYNSGAWTGTPAAQRREPTMWANYGATAPVVGVNNTGWSAKYTGYLTTGTLAGSGNTWKFAVSSHAGMYIKINGTIVYDSVFQPAWWNFGSFQSGTSFTQAAGATSQIEIAFFGDSCCAAFDVRLFPATRGFDQVNDPPLQGSWLTVAPPALSTGWDLSADDGSVPYTRVENTGTGVAMFTPDGRVDRYTWNTTGYTPDSGLTGHLAFNWTPGVVGWDFNDAGYAEHFNVDGSLAWAFNATDDRHPAALVYVYSSVGTGIPARLSSVKDPVSNRSALLKYSGDGACQAPPTGYDAAPPGGALCRIDLTAWGSNAGNNSFFYKNGRLAMLRGIGPVNALYETTLFGYDANGRLNAVQEPLASDELNATPPVITIASASQVSTNITYSAGKAVTVQTPEPAPTTTANPNSRQKHTYTYPPTTPAASATVKGVLPGPVTKVIRTVTWDPANLHELSNTDATGHSTNQTWDLSADAISSTTDAAGFKTTTTRDQQHRPTNTYGPAPTAWFNGLVPASGHADTDPNPMAHSKAAYDGGISGLAATWYNTNDLTGNPVTHSLWNGDGTNAASDWATGGSAPGINADNFSGVFTGEVKIPYAGATGTNRAQFKVIADDGAQLFIDDQLVIDKWGLAYDPNGAFNPVPFDTAQNSWHRIRIHFQEKLGNALFTLQWRQGAGGAFTTIPVTSLTPRYDLITQTTDPDGRIATHSFSGGGVGPQNGLETSQTVDPAGLNLTTTNTYEPASATTYFRKLTHTLPKGAATTTNDTYYGGTETRALPTIAGSSCPTGTPIQGGFAKIHTDATPAAGPAATNETIYNNQGAEAFTRQTGDTSWACTAYDARSRTTYERDTNGKTISTDYGVPGTVTTTAVDSGGTTRTTISKVDLLARQTSYTDEQGSVSTSDYDVAGRVIDTWRKIPPASTLSHVVNNTYDDDGRVLTTTEYVSTPAGRTFTTAYDNAGRETTLDRPTDIFPARTTTAYNENTGRVDSLTTVIWTTQYWLDVYGYTLAGKVNLDWSTASLTNYTYDQAGRLTTAAVGFGGPTRNYAYDANTNRCALATTCASPAYTVDNSDRLIASPAGSNYQYDSHGNLTSYTKVGGGTVTLQYDANDHNTRIDDGATRTNETLNPDGRVLRRTVTSPPGGTVVEDTKFGYDDRGDSPAWSQPNSGGTVTTYLDGDVIIGTTSSYQVTNQHGDIVGNFTQSGTFTATPPVDEFGVTTGSVPNTRLGWLGQQQRFTTAPTLGIIRMGQRLYDPILGRFLQQDPIVGGLDTNAYSYVRDPVNGFDLQGTGGYGGGSRGRGGKQQGRNSKFKNLSTEEVGRRARDKTLSKKDRREYQTEEKYRKVRHTGGSYSVHITPKQVGIGIAIVGVGLLTLATDGAAAPLFALF